MYLKNRENDFEPLEDIVERGPKFGGINISASYLDEEIFDEMHECSKKVGVWIMARDLNEDEELYSKVFDTYEVDFFYTDFPLEAARSRDSIYQSRQQKAIL